MLAMIYSTTSSGEHHPLDGSASMIQWLNGPMMCVCACMQETRSLYVLINPLIKHLCVVSERNIATILLGSLDSSHSPTFRKNPKEEVEY